MIGICTLIDIMCDASYYIVGVVLGQRVDKNINVIYYASKTLNGAKEIMLPSKRIFSCYFCIS